MARILYAEDDPAIAAMVEFKLSDDGHDLTIAPDGSAAHEILEREEFDLVLLDVMMPGIDGFALARRLNEREHRPAILMISARSGRLDVEAGMKAGADDYLGKPFDPNELVRRVDKLLAR